MLVFQIIEQKLSLLSRRLWHRGYLGPRYLARKRRSDQIGLLQPYRDFSQSWVHAAPGSYCNLVQTLENLSPVGVWGLKHSHAK